MEWLGTIKEKVELVKVGKFAFIAQKLDISISSARGDKLKCDEQKKREREEETNGVKRENLRVQRNAKLSIRLVLE